MSSNYVFKTTAGEECRSNQPLRDGGIRVSWLPDTIRCVRGLGLVGNDRRTSLLMWHWYLRHSHR